MKYKQKRVKEEVGKDGREGNEIQQIFLMERMNEEKGIQSFEWMKYEKEIWLKGSKEGSVLGCDGREGYEKIMKSCMEGIKKKGRRSLMLINVHRAWSCCYYGR